MQPYQNYAFIISPNYDHNSGKKNLPLKILTELPNSLQPVCIRPVRLAPPVSASQEAFEHPAKFKSALEIELPTWVSLEREFYFFWPPYQNYDFIISPNYDHNFKKKSFVLP